MDLNPFELADEREDPRMDLALDMCYDAIFDGIPYTWVSGFQYWEWDHQRFEIFSLQAFRDNLARVLDIYREHNLAEEYARRFAEEPERFDGWQGSQERHSTQEIMRLFCGLAAWIQCAGVRGVRAQIIQLFAATHGNRAALHRHLRALMSNPAGPACTPVLHSAPSRRQDTDLSRLPGRPKADMGAMRGLLAEMGALRGVGDTPRNDRGISHGQSHSGVDGRVVY
jgi:hypothetical protein